MRSLPHPAQGLHPAAGLHPQAQEEKAEGPPAHVGRLTGTMWSPCAPVPARCTHRA